MAENNNQKLLDLLPTKLKQVGEFCLIEKTYENSDILDQQFVQSMKSIAKHHVDHSPFYRALLDRERVDLDSIKTVEDCLKLPPVWAHYFKQSELLSIPKENVFLHLTSSGTTGQKSQIFFDEWSIRSAQKMVDSIFKENNWITPNQKTNYILFSYETESSSKLGTSYTDNFLCKYAPVNEVFTTLKLNGDGGHEFDSFGTIDSFIRFAKSGLPTRLFGFPAFLYFALMRMKSLNIPPVKMNPASLVFLGGGWKSNADQEIKKEDLYSLCEEMLGIPNERLRDGFGSVEHCVPYVECKYHQFHIPVWSRVFIRDFKTLKNLPEGEIGFLHFVSPYITSMPAHSVIMGDKASLHKNCQCGLKTPYFKVHGRAGVSKNKSCAMAASELLKNQ